MKRDKAKDDILFNCRKLHELDYVASLYKNSAVVRMFLKSKCQGHQLFYSTHQEVYELIKEELEFAIPE
jgi:hypothetical protein